MDKRARMLVNAIYFLLIFSIGYLVLRYAFVWFLPFIFGFLFAVCVKSISVRLFNKINIDKRIACITVVLLLYAVLIILLTVFGTRLVEEAREHLTNLPVAYEKTIVPAFDMLSRWSTETIGELLPNSDVNTKEILNIFKENTGTLLITMSSKVVDFFADLFARIPSIFMFLFFSLISSLLIVWDYEIIISFFIRQVPEKVKNVLVKGKRILFNSILKLLKAYFILMLITFAELLVGFLILGIEKPVLKAVLISFADFLPFIGVSFILVPWVIVALLQKEFYTAIGLSILMLVITIIRNILEPKIVGNQVGLSPIVSLVCFYVGAKLFGVWGIIVLPIVVIFLKSLNEEGIIKLWK